MKDIDFGKSDFQFAQLDKKFKPSIAILFNQIDSHKVGIQNNPDLREVVFMNS